MKDFILTVMNKNYLDCRCAESTEKFFYSVHGPDFDRLYSPEFRFGLLSRVSGPRFDILITVCCVTVKIQNLSRNDWTHLGTCGQQVEMSNVEWISIDTLWVARKLSRLPRRINSLNKTGLELKDARIWKEYL